MSVSLSEVLNLSMEITIQDKARVLCDLPWLPDVQRRLSLASYLLQNGVENAFGYESADFVIEQAKKLALQYPFEWEVAYRINRNHYERVRRLKRRIFRLVNCTDGATFLTLTWRDTVLDKTSAATRRQYVSRFLNSFGVEYVANIDYGGQTNREHYHAVIQGQNLDLSLWEKEYGFFDARHITVGKSETMKDTTTRLAKYVAKLTNHAIKETTKGSTILYSRKKTAVLLPNFADMQPIAEEDLPF